MDTQMVGRAASKPTYFNKTVIEIVYKSDYCLSCHYMEQALEEVMEEFGHMVEYHRVDLAQSEGKERFLELSISIFGEEGVYKKAHLAPIPSMFLDGELLFDTVPPRFELENAIAETLSDQESWDSNRTER